LVIGRRNDYDLLVEIPESARAILESGRLAHLVTLNRDGSPQISCVWVGLDGDEIVSGHLRDQQKLRNVRGNSRVALSVEGTEIQPPGLMQYLVVHGRARITEGGAADLLQELAYRYLGPGTRFPPMDDPPPGFVLRIEVERLAGVGPWAA
jgi:PPOX class probable F420-dependent enzyme